MCRPALLMNWSEAFKACPAIFSNRYLKSSPSRRVKESGAQRQIPMSTEDDNRQIPVIEKLPKPDQRVMVRIYIFDI